jgi:segregation and condensation protein A
LKRAIMGLSSDNEDWRSLESLLQTKDEFEENIPVASIKASSLLASLELSKEGHLELRQTGAFTPIFVRGADRKADKETS